MVGFNSTLIKYLYKKNERNKSEEVKKCNVTFVINRGVYWFWLSLIFREQWNASNGSVNVYSYSRTLSLRRAMKVHSEEIIAITPPLWYSDIATSKQSAYTYAITAAATAKIKKHTLHKYECILWHFRIINWCCFILRFRFVEMQKKVYYHYFQ